MSFQLPVVSGQGRNSAPASPPALPEPEPDQSSPLARWSQRRTDGKQARRSFEPTWRLCRSFLAGRQWVGIEERTGRVIRDHAYDNRERHTVNVMTQYQQTVLGKLFVEDLRPSLMFVRQDYEAETITEHTQAVARYLWESELHADKRLYDMLIKLTCYGSAAVRCMFDPSQGQVIGDVPLGPDGNAIVDPEQARAYVAQLQSQGLQASFQTLRDGKIAWEALGPMHVVPPAGIEDEEHFPWLIIDTLMSVEQAKMRFPDAAERIQSQELTTEDAFDNRDMAATDSGIAPSTSGKVKEHVIVSCGYEMPTTEHPEGQVFYWNDKNKLPLEVRDKLPYVLRGKPHHGVIFFHYHRIPGRFWGLGLVEPLIGPQRQKNVARSQMIEMKDRNLGRVYARKGTITASNKPVGKIMELIEIPLHADYPQETSGVPVGPWVQNEAEINDQDMDRVAGLREVSLGQAPTGVSAYSAMALLAEQDERRIGPMLKSLRMGIGDALLISLEMARMYWPTGKQLAISGPDEMVQVWNFNRARLPLEFYVYISRGAPMPTSPAVESQKIFDIFNAATAAGQPLPVDWLKASLDANRALPLPKREEQVQLAKAEQENIMMEAGMLPQIAYWDDDYIHITVHRQAQTEYSTVPGNEQLLQIIEQHIQMHAQSAATKKPTGAGGQGTGGVQGNQVPDQQGGHGIEAQNGPHANQQGLAQTAGGQGGTYQPSAERGAYEPGRG